MYDLKEREEIADFIIKISEKELGQDWGVEDIFQENYYKFFNVSRNETSEITGTVAVHTINGNAYIKRVYVDSKCRGTGLAKELMNSAFEWCSANGYKQVFISTVEKCERAIRFYEKMGFVSIDKEEFWDFDFDKEENVCCYVKELLDESCYVA